MSSVTDEVGVRTELTYDIAGNVTKNLLTGEEYVYNVYGEMTAYTDTEGNTTIYTYDGQGNVTQVTDALGGITRYTYRKDGLLCKIEDASGAVTEYSYNGRGLLEREDDSLGAVTSYQYDKEDRIVRVTEPNGTVTEYEYNTDGNVTLVAATKENGDTSILRYLYAMDGSLTASISDTDILTYQYDELGQLTELHKNGVHSLGFGYDANGNLLWLKESTDSALYNPDSVTAYTYDVLGRLTEVGKDGEQRYKTRTDERDDSTVVYETFTGGTLLAQYTYHADGTLNTMTDGAGTVTDYAYTLHKQVEQMQTVSVSGELLYSESNTYDGNGSLLERVTSGSAVTTNNAQYTYDALDRLLSEVVDGVTTTYTYDVMGNRLTKNADGVETAYTYDLCNKLLEEVTERPTDEAGLVDGAVETGTDTLATLLTTTYSYDAVGNLIEKITSDGTVTYTYDALNQLTNVTNPDGTWQTSTYDASGIRSMISENGITAEYVNFNGLVIGGYDKDHTKTEHYYYGTSLLATELLTKTEEPDGSKYSTNLYYYIQNSHGDVIGLTGNDGTLTETYTYDAFGTLTYIQNLNEEGVLAQTDTALSRFLYAGEQYDEVTGLYYLRARRYDTTVGRFTQEDTYLGDGRNLHVYVGNNPLKYVDPSGHSKKDLGYGLTDVQKMQNAAYYYADGQAAMAGQSISVLINEQIQKALDQLPPGGEQRFRDGAWNVFKGVGVIATGVAAIYALPAAAPALTVAGTKILAGTSFAFGASDITEGTQDFIYGSTGDTETASFNPIRDTIFGGNRQNYNAFEFALAGSAFGTGVYYSSAFSAPMLSGNVAKYANVLGGVGELLDSVGEVADSLGNLAEGIYSPINPGPLPTGIAETFMGATYVERVLEEDTVMYRVSGGTAGEVGAYLSLTPQGGGLQSQIDLALNPAWGNTAENVTEVLVPKGTTIFEGIAAPQNIFDALGNVIGHLLGGGSQIYIPKVDERWFR
ncbi:MAG: RHS repeat protein [Lachnospiraceae bacterium]|nr:RHS repeat protein [Lachnospiraceae bacterium]